jgi:hypothetical protein
MRNRFPLFVTLDLSAIGRRALISAIFMFCLVTVPAFGQELLGPGQPVFVSTFTGGQILRVDSNRGTTTVIYSDTSTSDSGPNFQPEGLTIGPDGKLYVCVPLNNKILRMNQDGSQVETVYSGSPTGPEGPSFNGNDLFFNTRSPSSGVWEIAGIGAIPFGGPFSAPTNVIFDPCEDVNPCFNVAFGEGTAVETFMPVITKLLPPSTPRLANVSLGTRFSGSSSLRGPRPIRAFRRTASGRLLAATQVPGDPDLLIVDRSTPAIWHWTPIGGTSISTLATNTSCDGTCLDTPIGIAVNNNTGDIYVGNFGQSSGYAAISHFDSSGSFIGTLVSSTLPEGFHFGTGDRPAFMALDGTGKNLFVVTSQVTEGGETNGKLWRVDTSSGNATLITAATCTTPTLCPMAGVAASQTSQLTFQPGTNVTQVAIFGTGNGAHSIKFIVANVNTPFTITVNAFYVPSDAQNGNTPGIGVGDGICEDGADETTDYDCRWTQFFSGPHVGGADPGTLVPQCYSYSDNFCVFYRVSGAPAFGSGAYSGTVGKYIAWNPTLFPRGAFASDYGTIPRGYDDPDNDSVQDGYPVIPGFPYAPENHQFVFDLTEYYDPIGQVGDPGTKIGGNNFNDFAIAFPLTNATLGLPTYGFNWISPVNNPKFPQANNPQGNAPNGQTLPIRFRLSPNSPAGVAVGAGHTVGVAIFQGVCTGVPPVPPGLGVDQTIKVAAGQSKFVTYNSSKGDYEFNPLTALAPGQYQVFVTSDLFGQQCANFRVTSQNQQ